MSFWRRAPRQVYRVYEEDDFLADEHSTAEPKYLREAEESGTHENSPEFGSAASPLGSRMTRFVGVGLLLGVTVGAVGLILSHLTHEMSRPRDSSAGASTARSVPASSRQLPHRASGKSSAEPESESQLRGESTIRASVSASAPRGFANDRRTFRSVPAAREPVESRLSAPARVTQPNLSGNVATFVASKTSMASAAAGGEFEFER
jgi:hypothetical protein